MLARIVEDVGADHVMLGTDHPFELADFTPRDTVAALGLDRQPATSESDPLGQRGRPARARAGQPAIG